MRDPLGAGSMDNQGIGARSLTAWIALHRNVRR
jgi:hypothetical protein